MTATSEVHDCRLFGDFYLQPPEKYLMEVEIMGLMLYIHRLEAALPLEHAGFETQSDDDIRRAFAIFIRKEVISWSPTRKAEEEIVTPSGSTRAKIALHLNHLSFKTNHAIYGEVCDPTISCMELVIVKGFSKDIAFWFDYFSRREKKEDAMRHYSAVTEACH